MNADELVLEIHKGLVGLLEDGQKPHEVVINERYRYALLNYALLDRARLAAIPVYDMMLFGMKIRFEKLPDNIVFEIG